MAATPCCCVLLNKPYALCAAAPSVFGMGQVNAKIGGRNTAISSLPKMDVPTIIFGADVTHPSVGAGNLEPSIASVVCSTDPYACR